jgi:hypothetical protein
MSNIPPGWAILNKKENVAKMADFFPVLLDEDKQAEIFKFIKELCANDAINDDMEIHRILECMQREYFSKKLKESINIVLLTRQRMLQNPQSISQEQKEKQIRMMEHVTRIMAEVPKNREEMKLKLTQLQELIDNF